LSNQPTQDKNTLAQVLGKINALSQKKTATASLKDTVLDSLQAEAGQSKAAIPVLTEVYEGDILHNGQVTDEPLSDYVTDILTPEHLYSFTSDKQDHEEIIKKIMAEMQPLLNAAVKEALIHELAVAEVRLLTALEKDLNAVLRLRLESLLKS